MYKCDDILVSLSVHIVVSWHLEHTNYTCKLGGLTQPGNYYLRARNSTVDLLVLNSLDQVLFILKIFLISFTQQATIMRRSTVLSLPP